MAWQIEVAAVEIELRPASDRLDPEDSRWAEQVVQLLSDLRRAGVETHRASTPERGSKGSIETIILALGSAGAFELAVQVLSTWLSRDRSRSVEAVWQGGGKRHSLTLTASGDESTFRALATLALQKESSR